MKRELLLTVTAEDPLAACAPIFANFVAISHVGTEVQLEFVFIDINQIALRNERLRRNELDDAGRHVQGKTVAKLVVPVASFRQLREHLEGLFQTFEMNDPEEKAREGSHG